MASSTTGISPEATIELSSEAMAMAHTASMHTAGTEMPDFGVQFGQATFDQVPGRFQEAAVVIGGLGHD